MVCELWLVSVPDAVLVGIGGGSSLQPWSEMHFSESGVSQPPFLLGHVEGRVTDQTGARGDLTVTGVGVRVSHPTVSWTAERYNNT